MFTQSRIIVVTLCTLAGTWSAAGAGDTDETSKVPQAGGVLQILQLVDQAAEANVGGEKVKRVPPHMKLFGPVNMVEVSDEMIQAAASDARQDRSGEVLIVDCHGGYSFDTIQGAIDASGDGDTIIVLPNTCTLELRYYENIDFLGKQITVRSVLPEVPEVVAATVIDGSQNDLSVVTMASGETQNSILDGLTITGGTGTPNTDLSSGVHLGGGIFVRDSGTTLRNCVITANYAARGGGIGAFQSNLDISNCVIRDNVVEYEVPMFGNGAAMLLDGGVLILEYSEVTNNITAGHVPPWRCLPYIVPISTPGILLTGMTSTPLENCEITNCLIWGNEVADTFESDCQRLGGGLAVLHFSGPEATVNIRNTQITENVSQVGAALPLAGEGLTTYLQGCTIAGNLMKYERYMYYSYHHKSLAVISNSIIYQNEPADVRLNYNGPFLGAQTIFDHSDVETIDGSIVDGVGNINLTPQFVDAENGDYHLAPNSAGINTGDPGYVPEDGETDIDGEDRVLLGRVDMGADESCSLLDCNENGMSDGADIAFGDSLDCNQNLIPDECDIANGTSEDCNENNIPDECDVQDIFFWESRKIIPNSWENDYYQYIFPVPEAAGEVVLVFSAWI